MRLRRPAALILLVLPLAAARPGPAGAARAAEPPREVRVAAAADLQFALERVLADGAGALAGIRPAIVYGSSGSFFAQIENGAPFDLFLSADVDYPRRLAAKGLADGEVFSYAVGRVALWVPAASRLDLRSLGVRALLDPSVRKVAIANPRHAPYGRAAEAALRSLAVWDGVKEKLVLGENVAQAAQFATGGGAQGGLVALSLALAPPLAKSTTHVAIAAERHTPLRQRMLLLKGADAEARAFHAWLLQPAARATLARYGFTPPAE